MCGIAGFLEEPNIRPEHELRTRVSQMIETLWHRGPDAGNEWVDETEGIALGHRRLSIVDLSPTGTQPMVSRCGRFVLIFNGEIYNYLELRRDLVSLGCAFTGSSDTEVLLSGIARWGLEPTLKKCNGMFALAVWDRQDRTLCLARDRMGEKPIYYCLSGSTFYFASELKALRAHPEFVPRICPNATALYLRYGYVPTPYTIYEGVAKLPPGTLLRYNPYEDRSVRAPTAYWSLRDVVSNPGRSIRMVDYYEAMGDLDKLLKDAVKLRMHADVPLGAFLSGGVDSSTIVALMQAQSPRPVKTFTIGFNEASHDEASHARAVAQHLGTDHTELYVTPQEALGVIPQLPTLYDEPFADSSQIPTYLVSKLARNHVTVSLSGDAGDELFGGYNRHRWASDIWRKVGWVPIGVRRLGARALTSVPPMIWDQVFGAFESVLPAYLRHRNPADKVQKLAGVLTAATRQDVYLDLITQWRNAALQVRGAKEVPTLVASPECWAHLPSFTEQVMFLDAVSYLPDDILVKVDRASMGVSLEARVPFLDHRVVEFAWQLPLNWKIRNGQGKWILRQLLYKYVPAELIERPKTGFGVPIESWLRGPLREWAESLLDEQRLRRDGFFDPTSIRTKWDEHLAGKHNWQQQIWTILMFQAWVDQEKRDTAMGKGLA